MNKVRKLLGIDKIHNKKITGKGITIAVLDTGIVPHEDFGKRIKVFKDIVNERKEAYDDNGHGTHIAGICCGSGKLSDGKYKGICPDAEIVVVKVLDERGRGREDNVIRGIQWIIDNRIEYGINIVNISFGTTTDEENQEQSSLVKTVERLWDMGIVVVAAAGNNGPDKYTITSPGISKKVITVGAMDDNRSVLVNGRMVNDFSSIGPTKECIQKPEVLAPATIIYSCNNILSGRYAGAYTIKSGTSMATPVVSGAIGLLLSQKPYLRNTEVKAMLKYSCTDRKLPRDRQGWGLINPEKLLSLDLF